MKDATKLTIGLIGGLGVVGIAGTLIWLRSGNRQLAPGNQQASFLPSFGSSDNNIPAYGTQEYWDFLLTHYTSVSDYLPPLSDPPVIDIPVTLADPLDQRVFTIYPADDSFIIHQQGSQYTVYGEDGTFVSAHSDINDAKAALVAAMLSNNSAAPLFVPEPPQQETIPEPPAEEVDLSSRVLTSPGPDARFYVRPTFGYYQVYAGPDGRQFWGNYDTLDEALAKLQQGINAYGGDTVDPVSNETPFVPEEQVLNTFIEDPAPTDIFGTNLPVFTPAPEPEIVIPDDPEPESEPDPLDDRIYTGSYPADDSFVIYQSTSGSSYEVYGEDGAFIGNFTDINEAKAVLAQIMGTGYSEPATIQEEPAGEPEPDDILSRVFTNPPSDATFYIWARGSFYQVYAGPDGKQFWGNYYTLDEALAKLQQGINAYG